MKLETVFALGWFVLIGPQGQAMAFLPAGDVRCRQSIQLAASSIGKQEPVTIMTSSSGDAKVDMNIYNLPMEQAAEEWTAVLMQESSFREEGVYLAAKSERDIMVDTLQISIPRVSGQGLGIQLLELAGGREDGLGITIVEGLVEGGCADGSDLLPGDSISSIAVVKTSSSTDDLGQITESRQVDGVSVECLGYDKTVEAILSLPPISSDNESITLTVKRLRRKPKVTVNLRYPPSQGEPDAKLELFAGENLRRAMLTRGVKLNDPLSARFDSGGPGNCGAEGTCATCVVSVEAGKDLLNPAKVQEAQILRNKPRYRMACKAIVGHGMQEGEMTIRVNPRQWDDL